MADNVAITAGTGTSIATDQVGSDHYQLIKLAFGALDTATLVTGSVGLPIADAGGSLTIDAPVGTPAFVRLSDGTSAITTLAVSAASLPLPSGASTAAKQPALGTAGTASSDVLTIQGIASMTAVKVDGSAVTQPVSAASLPLPSGAATAAKQPALGTAGSASADVITVQGIASGVAQPADMTKLGGTTIDTNSGSKSAGTLRVVLATDQPALTNSLLVTATLAAGSAAVGSLTAGTALIGRVSSSDETSTIYNATTALTPKFAAISASSSGNNTLVAAVSSKKIRVLRVHLVSNGSVNAKFTDGAGGSDLTGLHYLTQYSGFGASYCPVGLFETSATTALVLNLSGAVAVGGVLTYVEV